jgi:hypothetical protein
VLLPPRREGSINLSLINKIMAALATRLDVTVPVIRQHINIDVVKQFGKVRHPGGDTIVAHGLSTPRSDTRDATFVRVRAINFFGYLLAHSLTDSQSMKLSLTSMLVSDGSQSTKKIHILDSLSIYLSSSSLPSSRSGFSNPRRFS